MRNTLRMPGGEGVAAGQTATFRLPIGRTFHELLLTYAGVTLAQMTEIRLISNGAVLQRYLSGTFVDDYNQFEGRAAANGVLVVPVGDRVNMKLRDGEEFTAIGTGVVDEKNPSNLVTNLYLEIDIDAAAAAPAMSLKAVQSDPRVLGIVKRLRTFSYNPTAAGEFVIADLPRGDLISRIFVDDSVVGVNSLKIERDGFTLFERTTAENELIQADGVRVPQAGYWIFDATELGYAGENIVTKGAQDLRLTFDVAGGGAMPIVVEYLGGIPN